MSQAAAYKTISSTFLHNCFSYSSYSLVQLPVKECSVDLIVCPYQILYGFLMFSVIITLYYSDA